MAFDVLKKLISLLVLLGTQSLFASDLVSPDQSSVLSEKEEGSSNHKPSTSLMDCLIAEKSIESCRQIPEAEFEQLVSFLKMRIEAYSHGDTKLIKSDAQSSGMGVAGVGFSIQMLPWQLEFIDEFISIPDKFIKVVEHWAPQIGGRIAGAGGGLFAISLFIPTDAHAATLDEIMADPDQLLLFILNDSKNLEFAIKRSHNDPLLRKNLIQLSVAAAIQRP